MTQAKAESAQKLPAYPSYQTVEELIIQEKKGNCVPVYVELPADLITPCMAYLRVAKDSKYSFLLESVVGGENVARYSFIGAGTISADLELNYHIDRMLPQILLK
jgi:anthranilate synthase component 1